MDTESPRLFALATALATALTTALATQLPGEP